MSQKLKSLYNRLKSFSPRRRRHRVYIVPSVTGAILSALIATTYILSFADRNPWLASLAVSGLVWLLISLFLTHRTMLGLELTPDGRITNRDDEPKHGLRLDGVEIAEVPAYGSLRLNLKPHAERYRVSTFTPTGLFYAWRFQETNRTENTELNEGSRYVRGNPLARVDWKQWARRGRFAATPLDPNLRLRPSEELRPDAGRAGHLKSRVVTSDAAAWALIWSFLVLITLGAAALHFAPLWAGVICFAWVFLSGFGFFVTEKFRYWGRMNFYFAWIVLTLVMVAGKARLEPWMISTSSLAILFIPFALHLKISGATNLMKKMRAILAIGLVTVIALYSVRSLITERFRFGSAYYGSGSFSNDVTWGASLSSDSLRSAERFLSRGQGIFWVNFPRAQQLAYRAKLPYWRESTYAESRGGLNWSAKMLAADSGFPINVNLFLPGRDALQLQREVPSTNAYPAVTAFDPPPKRPYWVYSQKVRELAGSLGLSKEQPLESANKIIEWMKKEKFRYTLQPGRMADVEEFLFRKKLGLCQHYAGALAFILRAANIPARVVAGYQGGEVNYDEETLLMHDYDSHAWVEVWNPPAKAWMLVDPTSALFPNEYRAIPKTPWLDRFTRAIVSLQNRWSKLQERGLLLASYFIGALAILGLILIFTRKKAAPATREEFATIPKVREWEEKMRKRFHAKRRRSEGLTAYYDRMIAKKTHPGRGIPALKEELDDLVRELYAA